MQRVLSNHWFGDETVNVGPRDDPQSAEKGNTPMRKILALTAAIVLIALQSVKGEADAKGDGELTGTWKGGPVGSVTFTVAELKYKFVNEYIQFVASAAAGEDFDIKDDKVRWVRTAIADPKKLELKLTVDSGKTPKTLVAKAGDDTIFWGIYKVDKGVLSLCVSTKGFPKEFKQSLPESRLLEFKRVEKK